MTNHLARLAGAVHETAGTHSHWVTACKAALAAVIAWLVVQPLGALAHEYPYYAPLGATVAMSTTVIKSVRSAARAVSAILLGAAIALCVDATNLPQLPAIGLVIGIGTVVSRWCWLGSMGTWVPFSALFVLIVGGDHPWNYVLAYGGLTALGAVVGVAVNWLLPLMPLTQAVHARNRLRLSIADQFDALTSGLSAARPLSPEQWKDICASLDPQTHHVQDLMSQAVESARGNWRAGLRDQLRTRNDLETEALERLAHCADGVVALVCDPGAPLHGVGTDADRLRTAIGRALQQTALMLRADAESSAAGDSTTSRQAATRHARSAVADLTSVVFKLGVEHETKYLKAAVIATDIACGVDAWRSAASPQAQNSRVR